VVEAAIEMLLEEFGSDGPRKRVALKALLDGFKGIRRYLLCK